MRGGPRAYYSRPYYARPYYWSRPRLNLDLGIFLGDPYPPVYPYVDPYAYNVQPPYPDYGSYGAGHDMRPRQVIPYRAPRRY